jgi:hypothetical protein
MTGRQTAKEARPKMTAVRRLTGRAGVNESNKPAGTSAFSSPHDSPRYRYDENRNRRSHHDRRHPPTSGDMQGHKRQKDIFVGHGFLHRESTCRQGVWGDRFSASASGMQNGP